MFEQIYNLCAEYSFLGTILIFICVNAFMFYRANFRINRNTSSGDQIMDAYLRLRTFRERPSSSEFRYFMPPEERKRLAQSLLNLEEKK